MDKLDDPAIRVWYMAETLANGWSRNVLLAMIRSAAHRRKGKSITEQIEAELADSADLQVGRPLARKKAAKAHQPARKKHVKQGRKK